ncbi:type I restriction-modification system subunit M N-terminal domain-containing protein [Microcoleus vaginatus]|uniref:type I restriction-modification system subunit M N-terminal domain-containing protein n=1 Tax=Microcoleus vaginatus TaxID=119532 RepID=UPI00031AF6E3
MPARYTQPEKRLWEPADELWANSKLKSSEYSVPVLGLVFLLYADSKFALVSQQIAAGSSRRRTVGKPDYQELLGALFAGNCARIII